ncbi:DALR domain-containing protein, partial [Porphyromonas loveana]
FITLEQFFTGDHPNLYKPYSPMTIRFFILGAQYRGTVDFSNEALEAAEKGMERLLDAAALLDGLKTADATSVEVAGLRKRCYDAMNDDLNSPMVIAALFDAARAINAVHNGQGTITQADLDELREVFRLFLFDLLGMRDERASRASGNEAFAKAMDLLLNIRAEAKARKDWATSDKIRDELTDLGFTIKDTKDGAEWKLN